MIVSLDFLCSSNFFKNTFFPSAIIEWNIVDPSLQNSASYNVFKNSILKYVRPSSNKIFKYHKPKGIKHYTNNIYWRNFEWKTSFFCAVKLVTRLRLGQSHFWEHKFKRNSQDTLNRLWGSDFEKETTSHCFHHCPLFHAERSTLLNNVKEIDSTGLNRGESVVAHILLYSDECFKNEVNLLIVNATIHFVLSTNRFYEPLYLPWIH